MVVDYCRSLSLLFKIWNLLNTACRHLIFICHQQILDSYITERIHIIFSLEWLIQRRRNSFARNCVCEIRCARVILLIFPTFAFAVSRKSSWNQAFGSLGRLTYKKKQIVPNKKCQPLKFKIYIQTRWTFETVNFRIRSTFIVSKSSSWDTEWNTITNILAGSVSPGLDSPRVAGSLVFITCHFGKILKSTELRVNFIRILLFSRYIISCLDNEHFSRQYSTQTNKLRLKLKLKKFSTIFHYSWKEKTNTFCENNAEIYINLLVPNKFRRPSFFSSTLNTEYSIFIKQNKKYNYYKTIKNS
jgi:hypothetical protein